MSLKYSFPISRKAESIENYTIFRMNANKKCKTTFFRHFVIADLKSLQPILWSMTFNSYATLNGIARRLQYKSEILVSNQLIGKIKHYTQTFGTKCILFVRLYSHNAG